MSTCCEPSMLPVAATDAHSKSWGCRTCDLVVKLITAPIAFQSVTVHQWMSTWIGPTGAGYPTRRTRRHCINWACDRSGHVATRGALTLSVRSCTVLHIKSVVLRQPSGQRRKAGHAVAAYAKRLTANRRRDRSVTASRALISIKSGHSQSGHAQQASCSSAAINSAAARRR